MPVAEGSQDHDALVNGDSGDVNQSADPLLHFSRRKHPSCASRDELWSVPWTLRTGWTSWRSSSSVAEA